MAREKLNQFISDKDITKELTEDRIAYTHDTPASERVREGADLGIDPTTGLDLVGPLGLVPDFAAYLQEINDVTYSINTSQGEGGVSHEYALSLDMRQGTTGEDGSLSGVPLEPSNDQGANVFIATSDNLTPGTLSNENSTLAEVMNSYSSGYIGADDLATIISKDNVTPDLSGKHAHEMLAEINGQQLNTTGETHVSTSVSDSEKPAVEVTKSITIDRNRFSDSENKAFAPKNTSVPVFEGVKTDDESGTVTSQNQFGNYNKNMPPVFLENLKKVGISLLRKAAGYQDGESPGTSSGTGATPKWHFGSGLTSLDIEDVKVDPSLLRAKNAEGAPQLDGGASTRDDRGAFLTSADELTSTAMSYGSTYTPDAPFYNAGDEQLKIGIMATVAVTALMSLVTDLLTSIDSKSDSMVDLQKGPYFTGKATKVARSASYSLLRSAVLVPTHGPYKACVERGMEVMIGGDEFSNYTGIVNDSPGFWIAISKKIIIGYKNTLESSSGLLESFSSSSTSGVDNAFSSILEVIQSNGLISMMNAFATIGDASLHYDPTGFNKEGAQNWDVDKLPDGPATKISKSRVGNGLTANSLAWRGSNVPSLYILPRNIFSAVFELGNLANGQNPAKGMLASHLVKDTFVDVSAEGPSARVSTDVVERLENLLDAEYVPFYFHDLRTNEIVAFHAFLDSLSDSYRPEYSRQPGYGRMDSVKVYKSTTRSLRLSFYVAATSKEDFDQMWWKINKLTTLIYPQWTKGTLMTTQRGGEGGDAAKSSTFTQPFSQVLGSSPLIRLRIGDVIKSNYSQFNLARIFGIGDSDVEALPPSESGAPNPFMEFFDYSSGKNLSDGGMITFESVFDLLYGSPMSWSMLSDDGEASSRMLRAAASQLLVNGFANPLGAALIMRELQDPDSITNTFPSTITLGGAISSAATSLRAGVSDILGYTPLSFPLLRPTTGYTLTESADSANPGRKWKITRSYRVLVKSREVVTDIPGYGTGDSASNGGKSNSRPIAPKQKTRYKVMIFDFNAPHNFFGLEFLVSHAELIPNPGALFNTFVLPAISLKATLVGVAQSIVNEAATIVGIPADTLTIAAADAKKFMNAINNPITRAFESASGRGLAGVITSLNYEWLDGTNTWEIDWNSRAPKYAKVSLDYDVIHDLPPGLDHSGYNRAPIYNVGDIMRNVGGDPYRDGGAGSHDAFKMQGARAIQNNEGDD